MGGPSLSGNETVNLGDYLISNAFHLCSQLDSQTSALLIGAVTTRLCEGELLQLYHRDDFALDEKTYYEIVERKTAELIGVATELGARYAGASARVCRRLRDFGVKLGVAFQIQDDLLDLTPVSFAESVGRTRGKLTLPLIHHPSPVCTRSGRSPTSGSRRGAPIDREADLPSLPPPSIDHARPPSDWSTGETLLDGAAWPGRPLVAMAVPSSPGLAERAAASRPHSEDLLAGRAGALPLPSLAGLSLGGPTSTTVPA